MVLKKSRFSANTGATQRKSPFLKEHCAHRNGLIKKQGNTLSLLQSRKHKQFFDDDGLPSPQTGLAFSMKKKQRWLIPDLLEENILDYVSFCATDSLERSTGTVYKNNCQTARAKEKKKSKLQPKIDSIDIKIVLVKKGFQHNDHKCKAVYDSGDLERPVKKSKSWRCNLRNFLQNEDNIDLKYEVEYDLTIGSESRHHKQAVKYYKEAKRGRKTRKQKKRSSIHLRQLKDDLDILYDNDQDYNLLTDAEESDLFEGAVEEIGKAENPPLKDFVISKKRHLKAKVPGHCIGVSSQSEDVEYSNNHASSELVVCIPKKNVMTHVPEAHNLIAEISSEQHSHSYIMTPTATTEETDANGHSKCNSTVEVFTIDIIVGSLDKKTLEQNYGKAYVEGRAYPRRFAIFLNQVRKSVPIRDNIVIVVEIRNGMTTIKELERLDAVPVKVKVFNAKSGSLTFQPEETRLERVYDFLCVVHCIMNTCVPSSIVEDVINIKEPNYTQIPEVIQKFVKWKTKPIIESEAFDLVFDNVVHNGTKTINTECTMNYVEDLVCLVCYTRLSPSTPWNWGSIAACSRADEGAALTSCCHWLCKYCWTKYLDIKINEGSFKIECPFTDCDNTVDIVTCLSLLSHSSISKYLQMKFESEIQSESTLKWCPGCEKAAVCENVKKTNAEHLLKDIPYVSCSCKTKWCFSCESKPHWPVSCDLYSEYRELQDKDVGILFDESGRPHQTEVEVKPCPYCKTPINKSDGCNYMACGCGWHFCWNCGKPLVGHGKQKPCVRKKVTTHVFSSLEEHPERKAIERALKYQSQIIIISERMKGLEKGREPGTQLSAVDPRLGLLKNAFDFRRDCGSVLECVALAITKSKSRHFNRRSTKFFDRIDFLLTDFDMTLNAQNLEKINYTNLASLIKAIEEAMLSLKYFGV